MEKVQENNLIIILENGTSLVIEEKAVDILNDIKRQYKNFKIYKANEMKIKEDKIEVKEKENHDKKKKIITIFFQNGMELDLEDPTDEMIAEIIEKFDNTIIIEKSNKLNTPTSHNTTENSKMENMMCDLDFPCVTTYTSNPFIQEKKVNAFIEKTQENKIDEKKITKKDVREALLKPGTPVGGQILPPLALFALYHSLTE
jgi:hypothetical protein